MSSRRSASYLPPALLLLSAICSLIKSSPPFCVCNLSDVWVVVWLWLRRRRRRSSSSGRGSIVCKSCVCAWRGGTAGNTETQMPEFFSLALCVRAVRHNVTMRTLRVLSAMIEDVTHDLLNLRVFSRTYNVYELVLHIDDVPWYSYTGARTAHALMTYSYTGADTLKKKNITTAPPSALA